MKNLEKTLKELKNKGLDYRITETLRSPIKQAKYYRKGRTTTEVANAINFLKSKNCTFLAKCIETVGPQAGSKKITWAHPGFSWHQWDEAADIAWFHNGVFITNANEIINNIKGYELLAQTAVKNNLTSGFYWSPQDAMHIQNRNGKVKDYYEYEEVDIIMKRQFENELKEVSNCNVLWWENLKDDDDEKFFH
ncbi:D-alanyl-D-alanine carboxypeptidase family protein [Tenacibaculum ovolyticum]|uniref:D-alanyl-D-alanine carboxypeptidase family protein n=1 Tax=Tenacibaculum ovolyticum TaxID=104270 RepID=UPI0022F39681|nr:D-alanyl-D-alanine carboxypeptidase family protein [Tenacibaculum ovolyticum]WBX74859.1 D-alanyl-D-alanine carboxypeptidase family protein [Tenacibaculum ovolyticum]